MTSSVYKNNKIQKYTNNWLKTFRLHEKARITRYKVIFQLQYVSNTHTHNWENIYISKNKL